MLRNGVCRASVILMFLAPRQDPNGAYAAVIPKFIDIMKKGNSPTINGDGSFSRDFTYVDNVVQANIKALTTDNKECYGEVFNIGAGGRINNFGTSRCN